MSEFQQIAFRAIDGPVTPANMAFMRKQSSRAEVTPWSFDNTYEYGDFRGDAEEMLRRGYDIHVHYSNFGDRTIMIRLPNGFPDAAAAKPYLDVEGILLIKDKEGPGWIISISPSHDGSADPVFDLDELIAQLPPLRAELLAGDLRPLYLAHLAVSSDDNHDPEDTVEAPVPGGLMNLTEAQKALVSFFGLGDFLVEAAAVTSLPLPERDDAAKQYAPWLRKQAASKKEDWLLSIMADPNSAVRAEMLSKFRNDADVPGWPTSTSNRTISELQSLADESYAKYKQKKKKAAESARAKHLAKIAADPDLSLQEVERLINKPSQQSYQELAKLLADVRDALKDTPRAELAQQQALNLKERYPHRTTLISELRSQGFLPKRSSKKLS